MLVAHSAEKTWWWRWQNEAAIEAAAAGEAAKEAAVNEASEMAAKAWAADATAAAVRRKPLRRKRLRARDGGEEEMAQCDCASEGARRERTLVTRTRACARVRSTGLWK